MAWGTNAGVGRMGLISDVATQRLLSLSDSFLRPESLSAASDLISNHIAHLPIFQHLTLGNDLHSSSDGQKFESVETLNARYSPKYFGLKKGVVAYTLVARLRYPTGSTHSITTHHRRVG